MWSVVAELSTARQCIGQRRLQQHTEARQSPNLEKLECPNFSSTLTVTLPQHAGTAAAKQKLRLRPATAGAAFRLLLGRTELAGLGFESGWIRRAMVATQGQRES